LSDAPQISEEAKFYWNAFGELGSERPQSDYGIALIPMRAILAYADYLEMTMRETDELLRIIRTLDHRKSILLNGKIAKSKAAAKGS
jgi:hypothetical protein